MRDDISGWRTRIDDAELRNRRALGQWRNRTIAEDARDRAAKSPERVCAACGDDSLTFGQAFERAERLAAHLGRLGLRPGDCIGFQLPNWLETVPINLAACILGLVVNPIVPIYRHAEVRLILRDCRAKAIFVPERFRTFDFAEMMRSIADDLPDLQHVIVLRGSSAPALPGSIVFEDLLAADAGAAPWAGQRPEAVKMVMYTSGTTGRPKGVLHTHETMPRSLQSCVEHWSIEDDDVVIMPSPVTHITGYSWGLEMPFYHGTRSLLMERWDAGEAVELIDRHGARATIGATPFLQELVDAAERKGSRLPSLKVFACGGAAVPPALVQRANALFAKGRTFRVYGSTEAPMTTLGFVSDGTLDLAAETDGRIVDYEVRIVDEDGKPVPAGREGEILTRGPALFVGYTDPAETATGFTSDGFFRMGDIGYLTPDDAIVITGRKKDLIIRGGENISAKEIEDALHRHPLIREVAAVSMPHARLGETVCAYVVSSREPPPTLEDLLIYLKQLGIARQKFPEHLEVVEDLPRTASGKVKKDILRRMIAEKVARTPPEKV
jgi:cyclohexanecarboxylate-CoA ligase